ncbi:hypothetical protein EVAR_24746_1 [Eumeta japonica]|uniref:Uncharacterized protein n=1 Tax=Eumeta variegata TaxID=151549 RepID=A0A4C1VDP0_EUMVA|nr:hypothetical protein EVAR_24746_1 [Eumeta japonica]
MGEIIKALKRMKDGKVAGYVRLTSEMLREETTGVQWQTCCVKSLINARKAKGLSAPTYLLRLCSLDLRGFGEILGTGGDCGKRLGKSAGAPTRFHYITAGDAYRRYLSAELIQCPVVRLITYRRKT